MLATVYRAPRRDQHGDAIAEDGTVIRVGANGTEVGTVNVILGGQSVQRTAARGDVVSTEGLIGVPADSAVMPRHGDTVALEDGRKLKVTGPMIWGRPHSLTGQPARYCWWNTTALHN
ncbi:hypothetical protein [uncultured Mycolicibacterium sp.]|uniref:hypothetical protein n=1 Tax=uncultured Mycolicibacterium sp. TaxID=2320817 RepID=UPI0032B13C1F